jgi:hypothetical protein
LITLDEIIKQLELTPLTQPKNYSELTPTSGYVSDMLSCVMTGAAHQGIWVTLQAHSNIVAVAALTDLCAVIITEGAMPDQATIQKANEKDVILLSTPQTSFHVNGKLWEMGLRAG